MTWVVNLETGQSVLLRLPQGDVRIEVVANEGHDHAGRVRLGFTADRAIKIMRSEIVEQAAEGIP